MSLIKYARVRRLNRSSNEDMKRVMPRGDGIFTLRWTMRTFSLSILAMKSANSFISKSVFIISFIASRITTESSNCLCARNICSARFWNCFGLTSSAPILRGFSILRLDTSRNLLANNCESSMYLWRTSRLESSLNNSGIFEISTS